MNKSSTKNSCFFPHFCRGKVKVQSSFFVLITLVALSVINRAWADCQENPIGVTFSKDVVKRFKSYDCVISGTVPGDKITFEFFTFTNMSASMILSGQFPATLSAIVGEAAVFQTDVGSQFKSLIDSFGERSHLDEAFAHINDFDLMHGVSNNNVTTLEIVDRISDYPAVKRFWH